MGLPEITINFYKKAQSFIRRSSRGIVCLIVNDTTKDQAVTPIKGFTDIVKEDWSDKTQKYLKMVFKGQPGGVIAVRAVATEEGIQTKETLEMIRYVNFDYLCIPEYKPADGEIIKTFLNEIRASGKKGKAVLPNYAADTSSIINFTTTGISIKWDDETEIQEVSTAEYCCRIAGICAGIPLTRSTTFYVVDEVVDAEQKKDPDECIDKGELLLHFDGEKFKIGRGVNSLQEISVLEPEDFKKIKVREGADIIKHDIYETFYEGYVGRLNNTYDNKQAFIGAVNRYFADLMDTVLDRQEENYVELDVEKIRDYLIKNGMEGIDDMSDQQIRESNTGSHLFITGKIKFLDAMEDLDMTLEM